MPTIPCRWIPKPPVVLDDVDVVPKPPVVPVALPNPPVAAPVEPNPLPVVPAEPPALEPELEPRMLELPKRLLDCAATSDVGQAIAITSSEPTRMSDPLRYRMGLAFGQVGQRTR